MKKSFVRKSAVKEKNAQENVVNAVSSLPEKEECAYRKSAKNAKESVSRQSARTISVHSRLMWKKFVKGNLLKKKPLKNVQKSFSSRKMTKNVVNRKSFRKKKLVNWSAVT